MRTGTSAADCARSEPTVDLGVPHQPESRDSALRSSPRDLQAAGAAPSASVIIPTYNRRARLAPTLDAVLADGGATEVIVVVDGSDDGTLEWVLGHDDPRLRGQQILNAGPAGARQFGLELARHDVVVFLDDDVIASPQLITRHLAHHANTSALVVLGYLRTPLPERRRARDYPLFMYHQSYENHVVAWRTAASNVLRHFWGGNFSMSRLAALRVGLHDPTLRLDYYEDYEFGKRCEASGLTGLFDPSLVALHDYRRTTRGFRRAARDSGRARALLDGPSDAASSLRRGVASRLLVALGSHPLGSFLATWGFRMAASAFGVVRWFTLQERAATYLQLAEQSKVIAREHTRSLKP